MSWMPAIRSAMATVRGRGGGSAAARVPQAAWLLQSNHLLARGLSVTLVVVPSAR